MVASDPDDLRSMLGVPADLLEYIEMAALQALEIQVVENIAIEDQPLTLELR